MNHRTLNPTACSLCFMVIVGHSDIARAQCPSTPSGPCDPTAITDQCSPSEVGEWSGLIDLVQAPGTVNMQAIHSILLHTGRILFIEYRFDPCVNAGPEALLFDPANPSNSIDVTMPGGDFPGLPFGHEHLLFCSGHCQLSDGRVVFVGGDEHPFGDACPGSKFVTVYDPSISGDGAWSFGPNEEYGLVEVFRWYPTATLLGSSVPGHEQILVTDGFCSVALGGPGDEDARTPAILHTNSGPPSTWTWERLNYARYNFPPYNFFLPDYPFMFQISDGKVFMASNPSDNLTRKLTLPPTPPPDPPTAWQTVPNTPPPVAGSSAVMFAFDKVMKGGYTGPGAITTVDLSSPAPVWSTNLAPMRHPRFNFYLVALPSGCVLAIGGSHSAQTIVYTPELYDPYNNTWTCMAGTYLDPGPPATDVLVQARMYHSSSVLLPDGSVLIAGGEACCLECPPICPTDPCAQQHTAQIFKPPYFFQATRPTICAGPQRVHYGTTFTVTLGTDNAAEITKVRLIHPGASTHSFDEAQRSMELAFSVPAGSTSTLCINAPLSAYEAPPGHYMLFVAKGTNGSLPSTAHWLQLVPAGQTGAPTITGADPPTTNPYCAGTPFRDVLQTGPSTGGTALTQGIGGDGTPAEGPYHYAPITVTFSGTLGTLTTNDITVNCTYVGKPACSTTCPRVTGVNALTGNAYEILLTGPIPPGGRTQLTFVTAALAQVLTYDSLPGDVRMDGISNTQDLSALLEALNNGTANLPANLARYDINRSGSVNTEDYLRESQLLNGTSTTQVWSNARVVQCGGDLSCGEGGGGAVPGGSGGGDSAGPAGGEAGGSGSLTDAQLIAALQAACVEYDVDAADCQQMITNLFGPQP